MDMPIMNPFGFHVLQVSSDSGKVGKRLLFEVLNDTSQAVPTSGGGFVVLAGEKLQKYSNTFEKGLGIPTPLNLHGQPTKMIFTDRVFFNPHYEMWQVDVAPSGQQLVLTHRETPKQMDISWVRSSDFTVVATQKKSSLPDTFRAGMIPRCSGISNHVSHRTASRPHFVLGQFNVGGLISLQMTCCFWTRVNNTR
jgi:hypothetical protein